MHPDQLLAQIRDLLQQYLQLGPDTPVAQQAQGLADAIDQNMGTSDQAGAGSPLDNMMSSDQAGPGLDALGGGGDNPPADEPPPSSGAKTFDQANVNAAKRLKKRNADQGRK